MRPTPKKFQDFRIKIFLVLLKTLKAIRLFQVQKIVRKIKSDKPRDKDKDIVKLEAKLAHTKSINVKDCRNLAFFLMKYQMNIDTQVMTNFFKLQVPLIEEINEEFLSQNQVQKNFLSVAQDNKRYKSALDSLGDLLDMVEKKKNKTKLHRVIKKEKFQLKQQYKQDKQIMDPQPILTEEQIANQLLSQKQKQTQKQERIRQGPKRAAISLNEPKNNYLKQRQNITKDAQQPKYVEQPFKAIQDIKQPDYTFATMHPSWQAKIEIKQQESNFSQFSGKIIKLC